MCITTKRVADYFRIGAVLDGEAEHDRAVAGVGVGLRVRFMVCEEKLADPAIGDRLNVQV